jgi:subtilisin family serine protease
MMRATILLLCSVLCHAAMSATPCQALPQQPLPDPYAGPGTNFTALDTDGDGLHDRLYTGDRYGRVWRRDVRTGANPATWMQPTLLADLGAPDGGRGFVAAPDVTRFGSGSASWLQIAIGTASTGAPRSDHRFYILHDNLTGTPPAPITEAALTPLTSADGASLVPGPLLRGNAAGYYLSLGSAQVLAQALTLDGQTWFTAVERPSSLSTACPADQLPIDPATLSITAVRTIEPAASAPADNATPVAPTGFLRQPLAGLLPATARVELESTVDAAGRSACLVDTQPLPDCFLDTRPRRTWWRREDAD